MDNFRKLLTDVYINGRPNPMKKEDTLKIANKIAQDIKNKLKDISVKIVPFLDNEYTYFRYIYEEIFDFDIVLNKAKSKFTLVIMFSNLGSYAVIYGVRYTLFGKILGRIKYVYAYPNKWKWGEEYQVIKSILDENKFQILDFRQLEEEIKKINKPVIEEIKKLLTDVYVNKQPNPMTKEDTLKIANKITQDIKNELKDISVQIVPSPDEEYSCFKYPENDATAFDIVLNNDTSKLSMVIMISKLGPYAVIYGAYIAGNTGNFTYEYPSEWGWKQEFQIVKSILKKNKVKLLVPEQIQFEEIEGIKDMDFLNRNATIINLLFYFDGPRLLTNDSPVLYVRVD